MKKWFSILLIILLIGTGYVVYDTMQSNKEKEADLTALQAQIEELNAQLSGRQETGIVEEDIIQAPEVVEVNNMPDISQNTNTVSIGTTTTTIQPMPTPPVTQTPATPTVSPQSQYISASERNTLCGYIQGDAPNTTWVQDAKFINNKLQYVRDNGQQHTKTLMNEAYAILSDPTIDTTEKCRQSWLIDELLYQKGYVRSYETKNGVTTIGIDFISLQDDLSKMFSIDSMRLETYKNTSTKVRYYTLSQIPVLQTLNLDNRGNVLPGYKYLTDFTVWLNEHCNQNPIYNGEMRYEERYDNGVIVRSGYTGEIDRKQTNGIDHFCVKNRLVEPWQQIGGLQFDLNGNLEKIDLNRRHLYMAG